MRQTSARLRLRTAACIALAALSLLACAWLLASHRNANAFSQSVAIAARGSAISDAVSTASWPTGTVDVNTADLQTLCTLNGVGPVTAQAILNERAARGPFDYPEDLLMVKGIGEKTLAKFFAQLDFSARVAAR
jgi:competence protein ComEA